jgi:hypothetical protein
MIELHFTHAHENRSPQHRVTLVHRLGGGTSGMRCPRHHAESCRHCDADNVDRLSEGRA